MAVKHGKSNEPIVRESYARIVSQDHQNFSCRETGFVIDEQHCYLGSSSDGTVTCDCCGRGVIEIKCSYKHKGKNVLSVQ